MEGMKYDMDSIVYTDILKQLLNNKKFNTIDDQVLVNLYVTLLSLNDNKYTLLNIIEESKEIKLLLIKLNNLKVKIQLKRRMNEIENLINDIKSNFEEKENKLLNYITDKDELYKIIDTKDAKLITEYIDRITKKEIRNTMLMNERNELREKILELILKNVYYVNDQVIYITENDHEVKINVKEFLDIFNYLLNIDNYDNIYKMHSSNDSHKEIIREIIKVIRKENEEEERQKVVIPMVLTYMLPKLDKKVKTSDFVIENIKINDLYSMARDKLEEEDTPRWKNVKISNDYLFEKLEEMINRGMYYYQDNKFILELVDNKISDFKVSIEIDKMMNFLNDNLECLIVN